MGNKSGNKSKHTIENSKESTSQTSSSGFTNIKENRFIRIANEKIKLKVKLKESFVEGVKRLFPSGLKIEKVNIISYAILTIDFHWLLEIVLKEEK